MFFRIQKYIGNFPKFGVLNKGFTSEEIDKIIFLEKILKFQKGEVGNLGNKGEKILEQRNSDVSFLNVDDNTHWIYERLAIHTSKVNYDLFMCDIEHIAPLQYTIYSEEQHYDWHHDNFPFYTDYERKISGTLMLSDPDEYEGGELEIITTGSPDRTDKVKPNKGDIVYFSSVFPHKVHPVTYGKRKAIVFWVEGKREH